MLELPLVLTSGFLGSGHCVGMCGPFALILGSQARNHRRPLARQLLYSLGRVFTYAFLGASAGFGGQRLVGLGAGTINVPAVLALVAGCYLIREGLAAAGIWRRPVKESGAGCLGGGMLRTFLAAPTAGGIFLAGVFTGFMPCGLVYAFLAFAMQTRSLVDGALVMAVFGLGTIPIMVATGLSSQILTWRTREKLLRAAAWCVLLAGVISVGRGYAFLTTPPGQPGVACPLGHHPIRLPLDADNPPPPSDAPSLTEIDGLCRQQP